MSTSEPSATERTGTAEDVERMAVFMGWTQTRGSGDPANYRALSGDGPPTFFGAGHALIVCVRDGSFAWDPFLSADDDVRVLERVREVWGASVNWTRFVIAYSRPLLATVKTRDCVPHVAFSIVLDRHRTGDYARAALAALKEMETEEGR